MKLLLHVVATIAGICVAALLVFLVFGRASENGATQDGEVPNGLEAAATESGCGAAPSPETSRRATAEPPTVLNDKGVQVRPVAAQLPYFSRIQAAGGLCVDEVRVTTGATDISLSTVEGVTQAQASSFTYRALEQAFRPPIAPSRVTIRTSLGTAGAPRTAVVGRRAWLAFSAGRAALRLPPDMVGLARFQRTVAFPTSELRVSGWR